jgi:hypothetical protein
MSNDQYVAGSCNIGRGEIRRRQVVAVIGTVLSLFTLAGFISTGAEPSVRLGIFIPLSIASIGWVQSYRKFCLAYGFMGVLNFGKLGDVSKVKDKASLAADRKTAFSILGQSLAIAGVITLAVYLLPLS